MERAYQKQKRTQPATKTEQSSPAREAARPAVPAAVSGSAPSGHRVDLPDRMREKMESAFGADFSAVKLYENRAVADAGAEAVTRGTDIAFAPGMLDFSSYGGQALLGHELSHIVSQWRGEVRGGGFVDDRALEARADREGAMAAAGQQIAAPAAALSSATAVPAAGPMQAKKEKKAPQAAQEEGLELEDLDEEAAPEEEAPKKEIKSNGALEKLLGGAVSAKDAIGGIAKPLSDTKGLRKTIGEKLKSAKSAEQKVGKLLRSESLQSGKLSGKLGAKAEGVVTKLEKKGIPKLAKKLNNVSTLTGNAAAVPLSLMKLGGAYEKADKAEEYGTKQDAANAKLDVASTALGAGKKATTLADTVSKQFGTKAAKESSALSKKTGTGLGLAAQGVGLFKDVQNFRESSGRKASMAKSAEALRQNAGGGLSADEQEKLAIFGQGHGQAGLDQKQAAFDTVSDAMGFGSSLANTIGAAPVGETISSVQKAWNAVTNEVMGYETDKFKKDTVEGRYHLKEKYKQFKNDERYKNLGVSKKAFKKQLLRSHNIKSGTKEEAFEALSGERADRLTSAAEQGEGWAQEFAGNAGINTEKIGLDEKHREAARASFLKALGGSEDQEFHSGDVREYNAFQVGADEKKAEDEAKAADTRTFKQKVKDFGHSANEKIKDFGKASWASVKTGAGKAAAGVKRLGAGAWNLAKSGAEGAWDLAKKGAAGVRELATNADARKDAWRSIKTGVGNAADKVGTGVINAGKAVGRGAMAAAAGIKDFATNADTRKQAWETVKTGAGKAAAAVGSGLKKAGKYAWKVGKHAVKSRVNKLLDWYQEGVDQMNVHGDTYKQMGLGARAKWTMKNLPARMLHGTKKNRDATVRRIHESINAEDAVARMQEEEKRKEQEA